MKLKTVNSLTLVSLLLASSSAFAAGFAISEQSVVGIGRASSGAAVSADDASTIHFNPAGLSYLERDEVLVGLHYIRPVAEFSGNSTFNSALPINGGNGGEAGNDAFVPNFFYARRLNENMVAGIGITAPFGMATEYDDTWMGRYQAIKSDLKTININPTIAYQATSKLSLGAGVNLQYIDLEMTKAVDFGTVCAGVPIPFCASPTNPAFDGKAKLTGDDWSWGYNFGLMYDLTEATRVGFSYRSKISHKLKGKGTFSFPNPTVATLLSGTFNNGSIIGKVAVPESLSVALHHQFNDEWAVMGDVTWTHWSRFADLTVTSSDSALLNSSKEENWENVYRYGVGVEYTPKGDWSFRSGVAYEETPVPSQNYRTPRVPDSDRIWLALGTSYRIDENLTVDAAYAHLFMNDPAVNDTEGLYNLTGDYDARIDVFSLQLKWQLD